MEIRPKKEQAELMHFHKQIIEHIRCFNLLGTDFFMRDIISKFTHF